MCWAWLGNCSFTTTARLLGIRLENWKHISEYWKYCRDTGKRYNYNVQCVEKLVYRIGKMLPSFAAKELLVASTHIDCSQFPIFPWDRLDIPSLTVAGILIFRCTKGVGSCKMAARNTKRSNSMILRKNRGLWTVYNAYYFWVYVFTKNWCNYSGRLLAVTIIWNNHVSRKCTYWVENPGNKVRCLAHHKIQRCKTKPERSFFQLMTCSVYACAIKQQMNADI